MIAASYVINLAESSERWRDVQPLLEILGVANPIRFDAIDGRALDEADLSRLQLAGRLSCDLSQFDENSRAGEIGCALSHAAVLADIVARQWPAALVFEDDFILDGPPRNWRRRYARAFADLPDDWDMWYLYRCFDIAHRVERVSPRTVIPWMPQGGAAYAVTLNGARKLLSALEPVANAVDRTYMELVKSREIRAYAASPLLIRPGFHPSVINRDNTTRQWVENGINQPPEYWPDAYLAHLGEKIPKRKAGLPSFAGALRRIADGARQLARRVA